MMNKRNIVLLLATAILLPAAATEAPVTKKKKGNSASGYSVAELIWQANQAYNKYDLEEARRILSQIRGRKGQDNSAAAELENRINTADNYLQRVERIEVIDSITVPKADFFKAYKLPASSGRLSDGVDAGIDTGCLFTNEAGNYRIWSEPDSLGNLTLTESTRLTDGTWQQPEHLDDLRNDTENDEAAYPFMMADGVTLYYALNSPEGLGGYDIMVATRDASDGSFLQPQNLGMPYNSPYDDYLLAIDELNGVGWWATDRNRLGDDITIYIYKVNDLRKNYDPDDTNDLEARALLRDWRSTQDPEVDYDELLATIKAIDPTQHARPAEFHFPMDGGRTYTTYDDFRNSRAASLMHSYVADCKSFEKLNGQLDALRREYHRSPSRDTGRRIADLEAEQRRQRAALEQKRSDIYRLERN